MEVKSMKVAYLFRAIIRKQMGSNSFLNTRMNEAALAAFAANQYLCLSSSSGSTIEFCRRFDIIRPSLFRRQIRYTAITRNMQGITIVGNNHQ
jgi:hypothetical protein